MSDLLMFVALPAIGGVAFAYLIRRLFEDFGADD